MNYVFMCVFTTYSNSTHSLPVRLFHSHMLASFDLASLTGMAGFFISLHHSSPLGGVALTSDVLQLI